MQTELEKLTQQFLVANVPIVFQKDCGYKFIGYFCPDDTVLDLYNYIDRLYPHIESPSELIFNGTSVERKRVPMKDILRTGKPLYPLPERVVYSMAVIWPDM